MDSGDKKPCFLTCVKLPFCDALLNHEVSALLVHHALYAIVIVNLPKAGKHSVILDSNNGVKHEKAFGSGLVPPVLDSLAESYTALARPTSYFDCTGA